MKLNTLRAGVVATVMLCGVGTATADVWELTLSDDSEVRAINLDSVRTVRNRKEFLEITVERDHPIDALYRLTQYSVDCVQRVLSVYLMQVYDSDENVVYSVNLNVINRSIAPGSRGELMLDIVCRDVVRFSLPEMNAREFAEVTHWRWSNSGSQ